MTERTTFDTGPGAGHNGSELPGPPQRPGNRQGASPDPQSGRATEPPHVRQFHELGFAVARGVFSPPEIAELRAAFDRIYAQGLGYEASFRHQNVFFRLSRDANLGKIVRMVQWPSYFDRVLNSYRVHPRMFDIVAPILGSDLKQIINQMHWKPPGAAHAEFGFHQDSRFRRPRQAYRDLMNSYVQTGIAIDPQRRTNGAMLVYPRSHLLGEVEFPSNGRVMDARVQADQISAIGLDPANLEVLELEPGDVALWHLGLIHGSGPNVTAGDRRLYINGYVTAGNCDRGEWAFRRGQPCPLGKPVLVHYEGLHARPEPHYVEAPL